MPLYIDVHEIHGVTADAVAKAHYADMEKQARHGELSLKGFDRAVRAHAVAR